VERILIFAICVAVVICGLQTWRIERLKRTWAEAEVETSKALLKQRTDAAATISAMRGNFDDIMEQAGALPDADACGLSADRVHGLNQIQ
jgi:hypothetical protein